MVTLQIPNIDLVPDDKIYFIKSKNMEFSYRGKLYHMMVEWYMFNHSAVTADYLSSDLWSWSMAMSVLKTTTSA